MTLLGYNIIVDENSYQEKIGSIIAPYKKYGKETLAGIVKLVGNKVEQFEPLTDLGILPNDLIGKQVIFPTFAPVEMNDILYDYCVGTLKIENPVQLAIGMVLAIDDIPISL